MATAYPSKRKRFSDVSSVATRVKKIGSDMPLPWDKIAPPDVAEWLNVYAQANNTSRELLLASILPTVACLMGPTTIKVDCKLRPEHINLFMVCLSAPGSGKFPAFQNACSQPVRIHVEEQSKTTLFADDFTEAGLFRQLKSSSGHKAIVGKEEVSQFFEQILGVKERGRLDVERLIQLYDGATWVNTKGDKSARQVIQNPGVSIVGYSQPERFYPIYSKLKERRDGAVHRMLLYQPKPKRLTAAETKNFITQLNAHHVKDLRLVYEGIFSFCHNENEVVKLQLDRGGNEAFEAFLDKIAHTLNKQWEENRDTEDISKDDRHVLRLSAVLHVFYDQLKKRLGRLEASPPPAVIRKDTLSQAIELTSYFTEQRKILDQLGNDEIEDNGPDTTSMASKILTCCGPFVTVRLAQSVFSGHKRPAATLITEVMENLMKDGLGTVRSEDRTTVFYKKLPYAVLDEALTNYGVNSDCYKNKFTERAPINQISKELFNKLLEKSPDKNDLETVYAITAEE